MQSVVDRVQRWRAAGDGIAYLREPASQELLKSFAAWCRTRFGYEVPPGFLSFLARQMALSSTTSSWLRSVRS